MRHCNIPIFIPNLGCPFNCIFCDQKKISSQHEIPGIDTTIAIIEQYLQTIEPDSEIEIAFFGGNFTSLPVALQDDYLLAAAPYLKNGRVKSIRISTRPDCISQNVLDRLKRLGVRTVELGAQSFNDEVLLASRRGYTAAQVVKASRLIKSCGMQLGIQLMVGLPGDHLEADLETAEAVVELKPDMVRIYPTVVISGTELADMYRQGSYIPLDLSRAIKITAAMYVKLQQYQIKVIRMGLQPSKDLLSAGTVVAGPFHPAFGELVMQELYKQQARQLIKAYLKLHPANKELNLFVNRCEISKMAGYKTNNLTFLSNYFSLKQLHIKPVTDDRPQFIGVGTVKRESPELTLDRSEFFAQDNVLALWE